MKAIVLAAGRGTRLRPITDTVPKVMVEVAGKPLLEYNLENLVPYVDEFIIVIKYKKEVIISYFGESFHGIPIRYHEQGEASGTGAALWGIDIEGDCFIVTSDQIFNQKDIDTLARSSGYGALAKRVSNPEKYGIFKTDNEGYIKEVLEKPKVYIGNLASLLYFKVNSEVVKEAGAISISERGEYELLAPINNFGKNHAFKVFPIQYPFLDITSVEDLENANLNILDFEKPIFGNALFLEKINEYYLHIGIPKKGITEIIGFTADETDVALRGNTGDTERFSSVEKMEKWYNDSGRFVFSLLDDTGGIVGIWYGRPALAPDIAKGANQELVDILEAHKDQTHTGGIRIYPKARGKGLATPLIMRCGYYYRLIYPDAYMSIDIDEDNIPSQKAYEKAGYLYVGLGENKKTIQKNIRPRRVYVEIPRL